jgi:hypothetical protein
MALPRLRRQDFYTYLCGFVLILVHLAIFVVYTDSVVHTAVYTAIDIAAFILTDTFNVCLRKSCNLMQRHFSYSVLLLLIMTLITEQYLDCIYIFVFTNLAYVLWVLMAKKMIRHELCPAWTMLVYDSVENLEKAKTLSLARPDLINDIYHCEYKGNLDDIDNCAQMFKIGQIILCLDTGIDEVLEYCKSKGIVALMMDKNKSKGMVYIRPDFDYSKDNHINHYIWSIK